jgi:hypothetical protein
VKGNRRLENFVISAFPPDFTEFLPSSGPPLPDLQGLDSQMAKVESNGLNAWGHYTPDRTNKVRDDFHTRIGSEEVNEVVKLAEGLIETLEGQLIERGSKPT